MRNSPAIIGIGRTRFSEHYESDPEDLIDEAGLMALDSAGLERKDLDACYVSDYFLQLTNKIGLEEGFMSQLLEMNIPIESMRSFSSALSNAINAIRAGRYEIVLVGGIEKMTDRWGKIRDDLMLLEDQWSYYAGATPETSHELLLREYIKASKIPSGSIPTFMKVLGQIAVKNHRNGTKNPYAHFQREVNLKSVIASRTTENRLLGMYDFAPISDGATAIVLASSQAAKKVINEAIHVIGSASSTDYVMFPARSNRTGFTASEIAMKEALKSAKIRREDIRLAELYDQSTMLELISLEDLGFAEKGKAWLDLKTDFDDFKGFYNLGGNQLFVNTDGGLKADGNPLGATGGAQIFEVVKQLQQEAGSRQIAPDGDLLYGCTQESEGFGTKVYIHILGRENNE